jgi:hypothetical protein
MPSALNISIAFNEAIQDTTQLGAICARVLIVSKGWPTSTCAAPPTLPAISSLIVACVFCFIFGEVSRREIHENCSLEGREKRYDFQMMRPSCWKTGFNNRDRVNLVQWFARCLRLDKIRYNSNIICTYNLLITRRRMAESALKA